MNKLFITSIFFFILLTVSAQTPDSLLIQLQKTVGQLQTELKNQKTDFSQKLSVANKDIQQLQIKLNVSDANIQTLSDSLGVKIAATERSANKQIAGVTESVGKKSLFAVIGGVVLLLLSVALFVWLWKRQKINSASIIGQLEKTKLSIDEKLVAEFVKNAETMESLLKTLRELPISAANGEPDHSLALKLADEITLMERNISLMDVDTRGLRQLKHSINKLRDNLAANGYEIPELLGRPYNEGMKVIIANAIQDENLEKGLELITKIIKPQVNYQDKMIQTAQIEVSISTN